MSNTPLISIIVPIYNIGEYLDKCIHSICNQSYKNLQIILVNDGSTDNSKSIIDLWKSKDLRIEVIEKKNGGLVTARKAGIIRAKGLYSICVDGDDWIEDNLVETLVEASCNFTSDIVCAGHIVDYGNDLQMVYNNIAIGEYVTRDIVPNMLCKDEFYNFGITQYVWSKMFRTQILRKVQLEIPDEISIGEDAAITYTSILNADKINIINYAGYHYIQRDNSMCNSLGKNENKICELLIRYLSTCFEKSEYQFSLFHQLRKYSKLLYLSRAIDVFDKDENDKILMPFGGIEKKCNVVLYGAGAVGKSIMSYLSVCSNIQVLAWADKAFQRYMKYDFPICDPETYDFNEKEIDYIIICVSNSKVISVIRQYLEQKVEDKNKILSLTEDFMQ